MRAAGLTAAEVDAYGRDGQVTPAWRLPPDLLDRMRGSLDRLVAARADVRPDFIALPHVPWDGADDLEIAREFFEYATQRAFLDVVEPLIGPTSSSGRRPSSASRARGRSAVAPGRPVLADPPSRDGDDVDRAGRLDGREWLYASHTRHPPNGGFRSRGE
jgi:hypothetical protein